MPQALCKNPFCDLLIPAKRFFVLTKQWTDNYQFSIWAIREAQQPVRYKPSYVGRFFFVYHPPPQFIMKKVGKLQKHEIQITREL